MAPDPVPPSPPASADPRDPIGAPAPTQASFGRTLNAVLWGFFGVRKQRDLLGDAESVNPVHLIVMGVGMAAVLVVGLLLLVRFITH
ncbi:MAG TPA: DUF2970 domain-containing protein [Casimicrobiaceae bacterium]|jgi:hypothetical protein